LKKIDTLLKRKQQGIGDKIYLVLHLVPNKFLGHLGCTCAFDLWYWILKHLGRNWKCCRIELCCKGANVDSRVHMSIVILHQMSYFH
jgi:hypothetical protein